LWGKFLREEDLDVEIIDAHTHLGSSGMAVLPRGQIEGQIAYALERMDRLHIRSMIVSGMQALLSDPVEGNLALEESCRPYGDRFLGYLGCNPFYNREMIPRFDEFFSGTFFVGLKLLCDYWGVPLTDPRFIPVWEYAHQHRLPILLHTWEGRFDSPALLKEIAPAYPDAMILLGHSGGGNAGRREAEELAVANPNVYLEFCGSFTSNILWEETIGRVGADRVLFGTDSTFHDPAWELGRLLSLDLPAETIRPILGGNMRRLLGRRR
jgi:predicted TIM-barrel fold metal-dependent hydrolase